MYEMQPVQLMNRGVRQSVCYVFRVAAEGQLFLSWLFFFLENSVPLQQALA